MSNSSNTRSNRRAFAQRYGDGTAQVVRYLTRGWTSEQVSVATGYSVSTIAAVRANLTRGTYAPYVRGTVSRGFTGSCNF